VAVGEERCFAWASHAGCVHTMCSRSSFDGLLLALLQIIPLVRLSFATRRVDNYTLYAME